MPGWQNGRGMICSEWSSLAHQQGNLENQPRVANQYHNSPDVYEVVGHRQLHGVRR